MHKFYLIILFFSFCINVKAGGFCTNNGKKTIPPDHLLKSHPLPVGDAQKKIMSLANDFYEKKEEGVPYLFQMIEESISVNNSNCRLAVGEATRYLYYLAREGMHSDKALPALFKALEVRPVKLTINAARTIEIISGVQVGYDWEFVLYYKKADEPKRLKMIKEWKRLINEEKGSVMKN